MIDLSGYLIVGLCAAMVTAILTPLVQRVARKRKWMAEPDERRAHPVPTPNVGGIAFIGGLVAALLLAWRMLRFLRSSPICSRG